jgi:hypothetical protein
MVSNKYRHVKYDYIQIRAEAKKAFMECQEGRETQTDTMMKLVKMFKESKNRKCPDLADQGIIQT